MNFRKTEIKNIRKSHYANVNKSNRLKRLLSELQNGKLLSTVELQHKTGSMAIHSDIHELRCNGINVSRAKYIGTHNGNRIYGYQIENQEG